MHLMMLCERSPVCAEQEWLTTMKKTQLTCKNALKNAGKVSLSFICVPFLDFEFWALITNTYVSLVDVSSIRAKSLMGTSSI